VGSKNTVWPPFLTCTKHVFPPLGHCHAPSTPFTPSTTHTHQAVVSLFYCRRAQQSTAASCPLCNFREPSVTKSLRQNFTLFGIKTKCSFSPKCPILHIKFCKFLGVIPQTPVTGRRPSYAPTPSTAQVPPLVVTPIWPPLSNTFHGFYDLVTLISDPHFSFVQTEKDSDWDTDRQEENKTLFASRTCSVCR